MVITEKKLELDSEKLIEEASFADAEYAVWEKELAINPSMFIKYEHPHQMWDWRQRAARLLGDVAGKDLLDYGCGMGEESTYFAKLGARVKAMDISPKGVEITHKRAAFNGLTVEAQQMNALALEYPDESFDMVHGLGILHHIGLREGLAEVRRVLRPGGAAVFLEPLGTSPFVEAIKKKLHDRFQKEKNLAPVTSGEENLRLDDVVNACSAFSQSRIYEYRLLYRARKLLAPMFLWDWLLRFDQIALAMVPPLRRFAGAVVIYVVK
jgi:2-polyprenyl-3-methyl-5-hydroxy-6-metoxy-1,4-benzoquinol methylase